MWKKMGKKEVSHTTDMTGTILISREKDAETGETVEGYGFTKEQADKNRRDKR
jgi:hypothetical protein